MRGARASWLDDELSRIWLLAELGIRQLQAGKLRPELSGDLGAILAARASSRGKAELAATCMRASRHVLARRAVTPLGTLARRLKLSELETEVLIIALAPHIDPPLADLFQVLRGGTQRGVTLALLGQLLRFSRSARTSLLGALDPEGPLVRWRLIETGAAAHDASATHRIIQPAFGALDLLRGQLPSGPLRAYAQLRTAQATFDDLVLAPDIAAAAKLATRGDPTSTWTVLWGLAGAGKRTIASRSAAHHGQPVLAFDLMAADLAQRKGLLRLAQRDALVAGAALYVGPLPETGGEPRDILRELADHPGAVVLGVESNRAPRLGLTTPVRELALAIPAVAERQRLWRAVLPRTAAGVLEPIAHNFHLTPGEIHETAREANLLASAEGRAADLSDVRRGIDRRLRNGLHDLAWRLDIQAVWDDLVVTPDDRGRIDEFIARRVFATTVYGQWGLGRRLDRGRGAIALFSGPPGTGKTMLAGLIAKALELDLYQVDLSQIQSRWIGETEKSLGRVFDLAERAHAVLLFDEADSLLAKRTEVDSSNDRYANAHVNYLLQRLESHSGVVILTTNKDAALDEALQRRLTLHLRLDIPEVEERERLWSSFLPPSLPRETALDIPALAAEFELTGGYIKNVVVRAAFLAARERRAVGTSLLRRAATLEMEDMGRVVHASSSSSGDSTYRSTR